MTQTTPTSIDDWKSLRTPLRPLTWKRLEYALKGIESFPCKLWIKDPSEKNPNMIYYVIEDSSQIEGFLKNFHKQLRYATEEL